jgi:hypothetical protein
VVDERLLPPGAGARVEAAAGVAAARRADRSVAAADADELGVVGSFIRRPPPEVRILPLDAEAIASVALAA